MLVPAIGSGQPQASVETRQAIAIVDGEPVYEPDLVKIAGPQLAQLRNQEHQIKSRALDELIRQKLLEREAKKRGLSPGDLLQNEVDSKVGEPTAAEIEAFYVAQKDRLNRPLAEVRGQVADFLKRAKVEKAREEFTNSLRRQGGVTVLLQPPRTEVSYDPARVRGDPKAALTIVEFSDFECPFCARVQPVLNGLLAKYRGRVRLAFRDFPLREIHSKAQSAAEAARCAGEQGRFWEYHDALFADRSKLQPAHLTEHARNLGLDVKAFQSCLESGRFKAKIDEDLHEATEAGVSGTPAFFINGVSLYGAQPASEFERIIDAELAAAAGPGGSR